MKNTTLFHAAFRVAVAALLLLLVLSVSKAVLAQQPTRVGGADPANVTRPFKVVDLNTGAGEDWFQGCSLMLPSGTGGVPISSAAPLPVSVQPRQPSSAAAQHVDPDQNEAAPDLAASATRAAVCCQNVGTTPARVNTGANTTAGTVGQVIASGLTASDGHGATWCSLAPQLAIWFYDITGAGNADLQCEVATW